VGWKRNREKQTKRTKRGKLGGGTGFLCPLAGERNLSRPESLSHHFRRRKELQKLGVRKKNFLKAMRWGPGKHLVVPAERDRRRRRQDEGSRKGLVKKNGATLGDLFEGR